MHFFLISLMIPPKRQQNQLYMSKNQLVAGNVFEVYLL